MIYQEFLRTTVKLKMIGVIALVIETFLFPLTDYSSNHVNGNQSMKKCLFSALEFYLNVFQTFSFLHLNTSLVSRLSKSPLGTKDSLRLSGEVIQEEVTLMVLNVLQFLGKKE